MGTLYCFGTKFTIIKRSYGEIYVIERGLEGGLEGCKLPKTHQKHLIHCVMNTKLRDNSST